MDKVNTPLEPGNYYHIFNRGINSCELFFNPRNYIYFLKLYTKHIHPIVDTYAWVLMPNHFHFLIRLKDELKDGGKEMIIPDRSNEEFARNPVRYDKKPHQYFSNMYNGYTKSINKQEGRHGGLFERPFKRKRINSQEYLVQLLLYIHNNPVHHGITKTAEGYAWRSYNSYLDNKPKKANKAEAISWFDDLENFKFMHQKNQDYIRIEKWLNQG